MCVFKNTDKNNMCASFVWRLTLKKNMKKKLLKGFYFKTWNWAFSVVNQFFVSSFFPVLALKTRDAQILFKSVFLKTQQKVINCQKRPKWHFWWSINFLVHFQKYWTKHHFPAFLELKQTKNLRKIFLKGFYCLVIAVRIMYLRPRKNTEIADEFDDMRPSLDHACANTGELRF